MSARTRAYALAAVAVLAAVLYTAHLDNAPIYLNNDETQFALQAHAIATTARDDEGRLLPVYFHTAENSYFHPALVYAMAPLLAILPTTPRVVRLPTAAAALVNILLVYFLARRLGASDVAAIGASVLLALTPAHFIHGRLACDYLLPVPCVLTWLVLLVDYHTSGSNWRLFAAGCVLGLGLYTYIASVVMMPVYMLLTYIVLLLTGVRGLRPYAAFTAGLALLILPAALWLLKVPQVYSVTVGRYGAAGVDVLHRPGSLFTVDLMKHRWATYRSFFEWSFLFRRAEAMVMSSTYTTGVFLQAMTALIPLGAFHILRNRRTPFTLLILVVFLSAPLAASLIPEPYAIDRALVLVPMGAVIGAFGIDWLLVRRSSFASWAGMAACAGLCVWVAIQFSAFHRDYLTDYRVRSAFWFNGDHAAAFEPIVRQYERLPKDKRLPAADPEFIYLSSTLPWIYEHWKLYLIMHGRTDLLTRTVFFGPDIDLAGVKPGSVLLTGAGDPVERRFLRMSNVQPVAHVVEPDGSLSFTRFERTHGEHLRGRDELMALARAVATDKGGASDTLRQSVRRIEETPDTREALALLRVVMEERQQPGSDGPNVIRAGGGVAAPADMHGEATLEGFTVRSLPGGDRAVVVYFTPHRLWRGRQLWMHAYPQGATTYTSVQFLEPSFDGFEPGRLAWEVFRLPANMLPWIVYVGVEINHDLGPAYLLGRIPS